MLKHGRRPLDALSPMLLRDYLQRPAIRGPVRAHRMLLPAARVQTPRTPSSNKHTRVSTHRGQRRCHTSTARDAQYSHYGSVQAYNVRHAAYFSVEILTYKDARHNVQDVQLDVQSIPVNGKAVAGQPACEHYSTLTATTAVELHKHRGVYRWVATFATVSGLSGSHLLTGHKRHQSPGQPPPQKLRYKTYPVRLLQMRPLHINCRPVLTPDTSTVPVCISNVSTALWDPIQGWPSTDRPGQHCCGTITARQAVAPSLQDLSPELLAAVLQPAQPVVCRSQGRNNHRQPCWPGNPTRTTARPPAEHSDATGGCLLRAWAG